MRKYYLSYRLIFKRHSFYFLIRNTLQTHVIEMVITLNVDISETAGTLQTIVAEEAVNFNVAITIFIMIIIRSHATVHVWRSTNSFMYCQFFIQLHVDFRHVTRSSDSGYNSLYASGHFSGLKLLRFAKTWYYDKII